MAEKKEKEKKNAAAPARAKSRKKAKRKSGAPVSRLRLWARVAALSLVVLLVALAVAGNAYVHHSTDWLAKHDGFLTAPLEWIGEPVAFVTDALGWTGRDAVNTPDDPAPEGMVFFAGAPVRTGAPCPTDIVVLDRGEYQIGDRKSVV